MPIQLAKGESEAMLKQNNTPETSDKQLEISLGTSYRKDNLNWSEAGESINILSELKWEHLEITQISVAANFNFTDNLKLSGKLDYGSINSGKNQDSDYNGNNRTLEFSRSNNQGGGKVKDASLGLGNTLHIYINTEKSELSITPLVGISIHQQNLTMTNGYQVLPSTGPYAGLDSSYDAQWQGPWLGINSLLKTRENWLFSAIVEYHWADYSAHANWNLRPEFSHPRSFTHSATGKGIIFVAGIYYLTSKDWSVNFAVEAQQWKTSAGIDKTYFSDGSVGYYPLNGVNWNSTAINFGISYFF